jgi:hypothetical protein
LLLALLPPLVAQALGETVGSFAMFSVVERYQLKLGVRTPAGDRRVPLQRLAPYLSNDARRIVVSAESGGAGRDPANILAGGLPDLLRLACELEPEATAARVTLLRGPLRSRQLSPTELELECNRPH